MITLHLPENKEILSEVGVLTLKHGHLDHILKMTVKSLAGLTINEAMNACAHQGSSELRKRVRKLAKQKMGDGVSLVKLDALLARAKKASGKRNRFVHSLWARELDGEAVMKDDNHNFKPIPSLSELKELSLELSEITKELNFARLDPEGFLYIAII
jgi:hypothetical protein